jgi:hypothetical protein
MKHASPTATGKRSANTRMAGAVLGLAALAAAASLVATAPANASSLTPARTSPTHAHTVDITGTEYAFQIDTHGTVPAGLVKIHFVNSGSAAHQAQLFRLNAGVTFAKFLADLQTNRTQALFVDSSSAGGVGDLTPGRGRQTVWEALQGGTYAVISLVIDSKGIPDYAKGMVADFTVAGQATPQELAAVHPAGPVAGVITANGLSYSMPPVIRRGALYRYQDTDPTEVHEFLVAQLLPGVTVADAKAWLAGFASPGGPTTPQPFTLAGGFGGVTPGGGGWIRANMKPGNYVAFDLSPSSTGVPNAALGMVVGFTVK